jgi:hypothetical protein
LNLLACLPCLLVFSGKAYFLHNLNICIIIQMSLSDNDDSSKSSCPDLSMIFPLMMTDVNGVNTFIFSEQVVKELKQRVEVAHKEELEDSAKKQKLLKQLTNKKNIGSHGLALTGMAIVVKGKALCVGDIGSKKQPRKESNQEKYYQIKAEQEEKNLEKTRGM